MIYNLKTVRKQVLGIALSNANFKTRGFEEGNEAQQRLELVGKTVVSGYNVAVEHGLGRDLEIHISTIKDELAGFYNEGVAMGLYVLDLFSVKKRYWDFISGLGRKHEYMAYIGAGLASGVFNLPFKGFLDKADPVSGCLILDGIGFYNAYFKSQKTLFNFYVPKSVAENAFFMERYDNGIGRALWFYNSGDPLRITHTISTFPYKRRSAIWSGVGLAATYAGGVGPDKIKLLKELSGEHALKLAQGSVLATHARHWAGNPHPHDTTERILVGKSSVECNECAVEVRNALPAKRIIDGKGSFQVFLENICDWIRAEELSSKREIA